MYVCMYVIMYEYKRGTRMIVYILVTVLGRCNIYGDRTYVTITFDLK